MATKTAPRKPETPVTPTPQDLTDLVAQRRALDEQIKVAKAAMPQLSKLEREIARQTANPGKWISHQLVGAVGRRVAAGQSADEAVDAVLAFYRTVVLDALASAERDEADRAYDDAYGAPRGTDATN